MEEKGSVVMLNLRGKKREREKALGRKQKKRVHEQNSHSGFRRKRGVGEIFPGLEMHSESQHNNTEFDSTLSPPTSPLPIRECFLFIVIRKTG